MSTNLARKLLFDLEARTRVFEENIGKSERELRRLQGRSTRTGGAVRKFGADLRGAGNRLRGFAGQIGLVGGALGTLGFAQVITGSLQFADAIGKTADRVAVSTDALQEYRFAAELTGVKQSALDIGLQRFSRRLGEAAQGSGELGKTLDQLGIPLRDNEGRLRSTEAILNDYADAIQATGSEQEKLLLAFKGFDSEGAALVNTLRDGSAGLDEMREKARAAGAVIREDLIRTAEDTQDRWTTLSREFQTTIGVRILTAIESVANGGTDVMNFLFLNIAKGVNFAQAIFTSGFDGIKVVVLTAFESMLSGPRLLFSTIRDGFAQIANIGTVDFGFGTIEIGAGLNQVVGSFDAILARVPKLGDAAKQFEAQNTELSAQNRLLEEQFNREVLLGAERRANAQAAREQAREARQGVRGLGLDTALENAAAKTSRGGGGQSTAAREAAQLAKEQARALEQEQKALAQVQAKAAEAALRARQQLIEQGESVARSLRTPAEIYRDEIRELANLRAERAITDETLIRGIERAKDAFAQQSEGAQSAADDMSQFAEQAANNMQDSFAQFLFDPFENGLDGLVDSFTNTLQRMAAEAASAKIFESLGGDGGIEGIFSDLFGGGGGGGGSGGGIGDIVGKLFSGFSFFAGGGNFNAGQPMVVGERGPEIIMARQPGAVIPLNAPAAAGLGTVNSNITINLAGSQRPDRRTLAQIQAAVGAGTQRALERNR